MSSGIAGYRLLDHDQLTSSEDVFYNLRVRDMANDDKPREKLVNHGPSALSVHELVAILVGVGTKKEEVMEMSRRILKEYGEKALLSEKDARQLSESLDIPITVASKLIASFELGRRFYSQKSGKPVSIRSALGAFEYLKSMGLLKKETLRGLYLNSHYEVIHDEVLSVGSVTASIVHPREVFAPALEHGAVALILAHNHPSGSTRPTDADIDITKQLIDAGNLLGIDMLDHLVIADENFVSIKASIAP